jgi:hypothetical protein
MTIALEAALLTTLPPTYRRSQQAKLCLKVSWRRWTEKALGRQA